jgi:hypothetical protein
LSYYNHFQIILSHNGVTIDGVIAFIELLQLITTGIMLSLFYALHNSLQDTIGHLSLLLSSLAVASLRLRTADISLPLGS